MYFMCVKYVVTCLEDMLKVTGQPELTNALQVFHSCFEDRLCQLFFPFLFLMLPPH